LARPDQCAVRTSGNADLRAFNWQRKSPGKDHFEKHSSNLVDIILIHKFLGRMDVEAPRSVSINSPAGRITMNTSTGFFAYIAVIILGYCVLPANAQEVTEQPLIRPFPGTVFDHARSVHQQFSEFDFRVGTPPRDYETRNIRGNTAASATICTTMTEHPTEMFHSLNIS